MLFSGNLDISPNSVKVFCTEAKDLSSDLKPMRMLAICCAKSQAACSVTRFLRQDIENTFHLYFFVSCSCCNCPVAPHKIVFVASFLYKITIVDLGVTAHITGLRDNRKENTDVLAF